MERYERGITFITSGVAGVSRITTETSFRRELSRREDPEQDAGETVPGEENACPAGETVPAEENACLPGRPLRRRRAPPARRPGRLRPRRRRRRPRTPGRRPGGRPGS